VFRLFGTKKELFTAVVTRCFRETLEMFQRAAEGLRGREALDAMGNAYVERLLTDHVRLRAQMQAYVACDDPAIREVVRAGYGDLVSYAEHVSGLPAKEVAAFFAQGMLLNVFASMGLTGESTESLVEPWAGRLLAACKDIR
jgi:AcrR family transcriptional regulator